MSDAAVANGHLFLPKQGIYRIDEVPAISPTLSVKRDRNPSLLELWAQTPGFDDFTLMTTTTVTNWQAYATVFSRVENFRLVRDPSEPQNEPALFYRAAGEVLSPAAMSLQWKAAGIPRYRFRVLPKDFASDADRLWRFEQEAKTLAALNHPNVLTIHDAGLHEGAPYLVTELLEGKILREVLGSAANASLPLRKATEYALQIAQGLAAAH
jgi:serine/threonine protein kinase